MREHCQCRALFFRGQLCSYFDTPMAQWRSPGKNERVGAADLLPCQLQALDTVDTQFNSCPFVLASLSVVFNNDQCVASEVYEIPSSPS